MKKNKKDYPPTSPSIFKNKNYSASDPQLVQVYLKIKNYPQLAQVCSKAKECGVLVQYKKPNFVYICIKNEQKIQI